jgi:hypothetical protein
MVKSVRIRYAGNQSDLVGRATALISDRIRAKSETSVILRHDADLGIDLALDTFLGAESFRIADAVPDDCAGPGASDEVHTIRITGGDARGLLYGVGKFLRECRYRDGEFLPGVWRGVSVPAHEIRGMYFATHFGNYYEVAPVEEIERYVEELALWGCNTLSVWFDMHQYAGLSDPNAQAMIVRLRRILRVANTVGMRGALTTLANEGYANSPEPLRADWTAGHDGYTRPPGGHYHREICPSKSGGLDYILTTRREVLKAFQDLDIAYVWIWPYDQGGCTCGKCAPWGANGFLRTAEPVAGVIRDVLPGAKIMLSTWYFDHFTSGEWEGLSTAFAGGAPPWVDYLIAGDFGGFPQHLLDHGVPGGLPAVSFPEISMESNSPWGGYGINPRPTIWEEYERRNGPLLSGIYPYSEGIYEDINKVILLQLNWDPDRPAEDIVREYAASEFSPDVADDVVEIIKRMESGLGHRLVENLHDLILDENVRTADDLRGRRLYHIVDGPDAQETLALVESVALRLPAERRRSWRWRLLRIRAALDAELQRCGGRSTDLSESLFDELTAIYHATTARLAVTPPSRKSLFRIFSQNLGQ